MNPAASRTAPTAAPRDLPSYTVKLAGQALPRTVQVLSVRVQHELNRIPTAHLVIKDGDPAAADFVVSKGADWVPGQTIEILAGYHQREDVVFKGMIIKHGIEVKPGMGDTPGVTRLNIVAKDAFVKTTLATRRRYFTDKLDSDVAEEIVQAYAGLAIDASPTSVRHPELILYDATDWDFIMMRAEANGQVAAVEGGKLTLTKPDLTQEPVLSWQFGATLLDVEATMDARDQPDTLTTVSWNAAEGKLITADATDSLPTKPGNLSARNLANALKNKAVVTHGGQVASNELQAWADATLLRRRLARVRGRARGYGNASLKPGKLIGLAGLGDRFNGPAYITGVSHRLEEGQWFTDVQFGLDPQPFTTINNVAPPSAGGMLPAVSGLQIGVVTALEGDPANEARVKVRLPIISADADGAWARPMTFDAGKDRGFYWRPELGDEVVVGFLNDDPRDAVVLGSLHSSKNTVPSQFTISDKNPIKGLVTVKGLSLLFDDDKKSITLETPNKYRIVLDEKQKSLMLMDEHKNQIVMNKDGIRIESSKDIILKATGDIKAEAVAIKQDASAQWKATGGGGVELSSSATAVLKGSSVLIN